MSPAKRREGLSLSPEAATELQEVRAKMRSLSHGASANSLAGIPLSSGVAMLIAGATATARTMVAESLATDLQRDLFRIDLSAIVSQQIGETEKNLERILTLAQRAGAVLYIEERDALFGRRTDVKESHDRYANLEVGYLLERLEAYQGLVILATNTKENIDAAFLRRLRHVVALPAAGAESGG